MLACCKLDRPLTVRVVTFAPVKTLIVATFIKDNTFMKVILVVTPSTLVTLSVFDTKTFPKMFRERTASVDPILADFIKAFAK